MAASVLVERLRDHLAESRLLAAPGLAVLAVSGGGDSLAMLDVLAALAGELGLGLVIAHADHGILPDSSTIAARAEAGGRQQHPVILLHDGGGYRGATVAALPSIIDYYRLHGYRFVRLDGR